MSHAAARWWLLIILIAAVAVRLAVALALPYDGGPDERRRFPLTAIIYHTGHAPRYGAGAPEYAVRPVFAYRFNAWVARLAPGSLPLFVRLRLGSVVMAAFTVVLAAAAVRNLFPRWPALALGVSGAVAFFPQFIFIGSYLNADAYTVFSTTLVWYVLAVIHRRRGRLELSTALALGLALGGVFLGRQNGYIGFILVAIYVGYLLLTDWRANLGKLMFSAAVFLAFPAVFYLHQYVTSGIAYLPWAIRSGVSWVPPGWSVADAYQQLAPTLNLDYPVVHGDWRSLLYWFLFIGSLFPSSFGVFGYMDVSLPPILYSAYLVIVVGAVVGFVQWARRRSPSASSETVSRRWLLCSSAIAVVGMVAVVAYHNFVILYQPQGRYLLPVLAPLLLLLVLGWCALGQTPQQRQYLLWVAVAFFVVAGVFSTGLLVAHYV